MNVVKVLNWHIYRKKGTLGIKDVIPVYLKSQETWKAAEIKGCLVECKQELGCDI